MSVLATFHGGPISGEVWRLPNHDHLAVPVSGAWGWDMVLYRPRFPLLHETVRTDDGYVVAEVWELA